MGLIPWRSKQEVPVRKEQAEQGLPLTQFRREVNRLFENFLGNSWSPFRNGLAGDAWSSWSPSLDVSEDEKQVNVTLEVPGIDAKDIDISVSGNTLIVQGEKHEKNEGKGKDHYYTERRFGSFRRVVELPSTADVNSIEADYKNGVLRVTAKKTGNTMWKRIPVFNR